MIEYILKSKYLVTPKEREQLEYLHYSDGQMFPQFLNKFKLGFVILAKEDSNIVSWGLVFERTNCEITLFIYTRKSHRRLGIGSQIYKLSIKNFGKNIEVSRHNKVSRLFYDNLGA